jgi:hypothetical protein
MHEYSIVRITTYISTIDSLKPYKNIDDNDKNIGTGFFIDLNGYILTCYHVVENAIRVVVNIPAIGKKLFETDIISICPDRDLALLKIKNYINKEYLILGNSDELKRGENVIALGYPLGQNELKETNGVFSGLYKRYLQTNASINSGNSGGPLINKHNQVIGINFLKVKNNIATNIGYARPINEFLSIQLDMFKNKIVYEPQLHFEINITNKELFKVFDYPYDTGCLITKIYKISPFVNSIQNGDILYKFDNYLVDMYGYCIINNKNKIHLYNIIGRYNIHDHINIEYWSIRNSKLIKSKIYFNNNQPAIRQIIYPHENFKYEIFGGIIISELTVNHLNNILKNVNINQDNIEILKYYKNKYEPKVFISHIFPGSQISVLNILNEYSIIDTINGKKINNIEEVRNALLNPIIKNNNYYFSIKDNDNNFMILDINEIYKEEINILIPRNKYNISNIYDKILK